MTPEDALRVFGKEKFRPIQREIIDAALKNKDLLVLLPTGFGKSLTFQLPAIVVPQGVTLVISPLLALMDNQIQDLVRKGVAAATLNHRTGDKLRRDIQAELLLGRGPRLLYVSPELCCGAGFRSFLDQMVARGMLNRIVIDEAHCAVDWGREFRKEYAQLGFFKDCYPAVPVMALTATANEQMQKQIAESLKLPANVQVFAATMNRPQTHYEVRYVEDQSERLESIVKFLKLYKARIASVYGPNQNPYPGCGLIYCRARFTTERVAEVLRENGIGAQAYHAKLDPSTKDAIMARWVAGDPECMVIVATIAFGMGVDKPDTRFVIHFELPKSIDDFCQQSGRAGRDNRAAFSILYYSRYDKSWTAALAKSEPEKQAFKALVDYCETPSRCRHLLLAEYFEKSVPKIPTTDWCEYACDVCKNSSRVLKRYNQWKQDY